MAPKVLIVDDSTTSRMQVQHMLPQSNLKVLQARDGIEGLELILQEYPHLVLLDYYMPRMNGLEVILEVKADPYLHAIPVVIMSARLDELEKAAPELFDYFSFVKKPFNQAILIRAIRSALLKAKERDGSNHHDFFQALEHAFTRPAQAPVSQPVTPFEFPSTLATQSDEVQSLRDELKTLRLQNLQLQNEVTEIKIKMDKLIRFVWQKLK